MWRASDKASRAALALASGCAILSACGSDPEKWSVPRALRPDAANVGGSFDPVGPVSVDSTGFGGYGGFGGDDPTGSGGSGDTSGASGSGGAGFDGSIGAGGAGGTRGKSDAGGGGRAVDAQADTRGDVKEAGGGTGGMVDARAETRIDAAPDVYLSNDVATIVDAAPDVSTEASAPDASGPVTDACAAGGATTVATFYVSDLTWVGTPINGFGPVEKDTSNGETLAGDGHPMFIGGVNYAKGLGVHANSSVEYDIAGLCKTFTAYVGADDEVSSASITFEVWVDGRRAYSSPALVQSGQSAAFVSVDLTCASSLRLVVTDGVVNGTTSDHGDWADAKLTCVRRP